MCSKKIEWGNKMKKFTKIMSIILTIGILVSGLIGGPGVTQAAQSQMWNAPVTIRDAKDINEGENISGFKLESKKWIQDIQSTAMIFKHAKSGAKLIYLQNADENKVFSINFRTPVNDNTGVNHIIEHSVLCGSKQYPVKDPFLIMTKQSLSTFINAFTGPDFTMYPVASKNDKDFRNLMSVYLDAVFYPKLSEDPRILQQEGWHYEVDKETGELKYNGIVYNEMKGNYSSPQTILRNTINKSLFKENSYAYESGGNPDNIPNLTYQKFIQTYKKYYAPSNSSIYLYGKLDIENTLKFMNDNYLSKLKKSSVDSAIKLQSARDTMTSKIAFYPVAKDAVTKNMTYLSSNYLINNAIDVESILAFQILESILLNTKASPLRKALGNSHIGANAYANFNSSMMQPTFSIVITNANESEKNKFKTVVEDSLKKIVKEGFDEELVNSVFTSVELSLRTEHSDANRGMNYMSAAMNSWNYDMSPTEYLEITPTLNKIKSEVANGYFEKMVQKYLLDNKNNSLVILKPSNGLNERNEEIIKVKLAAFKKSLSEVELDKIIKNTENLKKWQDTSDSKESVSKIPTLTLGDLNKVAEQIPTTEKLEGDIKVLYHPMFTDGITYCNLYFDSSKVPQNELLYLKLLSNVLGNIDTEKYDHMQLSNKIMKDTGGISFNSTAFKKNTDGNEYYPKMNISVKALNSTLPNALDILEEIINQSEFTDKNRIKELVKTSRLNYELMFANGGNILAMKHVLSYLSDSGKYSNLDYLPYYNFICDLDDNFDAKFDEIVKKLNHVNDIVFNKEQLVVSYNGDEKYYPKFASSIKALGVKIDNEKFPAQEYKFDFTKKNEAFIIPSQVQYVVKAGSFKNAGYIYNGSMRVLENILSSNYLWQKLRIKGGAYGGAMSFTNEEVLFYSYRDPNLKETLNTFNETVNFLENFKADEKEMANYIIGTIGNMDSLTSPQLKGVIGDNMYFKGITQEDIQKERDEVLATTEEDIRNYARLIENVIKQNFYCVVGGETKVNENKGLFNRIIVPIKNAKQK
jgi:hypothetical protein